jgi:large subunit ribosomal protein L25
VPCIIYGGESNINFYTHKNAFKELIYTPDAHLVSLDIEGKKVKAVLKDIQFHPVTDAILHIDFVEVSESKPVTINIPITVIGDSPGVKAGGKLRIKARNLRVKGLINDIPEFLVVDISDLKIGQSIKVGDLTYDKIDLLDSKKDLILSVATSRGIAKDALAEGEESPEAEGEAPAAE